MRKCVDIAFLKGLSWSVLLDVLTWTDTFSVDLTVDVESTRRSLRIFPTPVTSRGR